MGFPFRDSTSLSHTSSQRNFQGKQNAGKTANDIKPHEKVIGVSIFKQDSVNILFINENGVPDLKWIAVQGIARKIFKVITYKREQTKVERNTRKIQLKRMQNVLFTICFSI